MNEEANQAMTEHDPEELATRCAEAVESLIACAEHLELNANTKRSPEFCWWDMYWEARIHLRELALLVIQSPFRECHPDRRSINYKSVSQDITEDMRGIMDPTGDYHICPQCQFWVPPLNPCIGCFIKASGIITPKTPSPPSSEF